MDECERGGAKRRRESIANKNSKVAPPGLTSFRHPCIEPALSLKDKVQILKKGHGQTFLKNYISSENIINFFLVFGERTNIRNVRYVVLEYATTHVQYIET